MPNIPKKKVKNNILELYLGRQKNFLPGIKNIPSPDLHYSIVIPCYNEPDVISTLESIKNNPLPLKAIEIIIVVNSPVHASRKVLEQNIVTIGHLKEWQARNNTNKMSMYFIHEKDIPGKIAGAGYARKRGMDEAIYRLIQVDNPEGIIISLDADTLCANNYLFQIEKFYQEYPQASGCNINFEHTIETIKNPHLKYAIAQYELYLRYFKESLLITGFPYAFHTIGSCFSVCAKAYCMQGGMNTRQAGEDFYFLQKIFYLNHFYELNSTCVYPSPRMSERVIFGTGATIHKLVVSSEPYQVYNFNSFLFFKDFFHLIPHYYSKPEQTITDIEQLPAPFVSYLQDVNAFKKIYDLKVDVSNERQFQKRVFQIFNNFFIIKGLNFLHLHSLKKIPVTEASEQFLNFANVKPSADVYQLLKIFRKLQNDRPVNLHQ